MSSCIDTSTHIRINNLGCENRLPLENERGVKVLEIFVLGEYNPSNVKTIVDVARYVTTPSGGYEDQLSQVN